MRKIIVDIFNIVAQFSLLLTSQQWETAEDDGAVEHPNFEMIEESYKKFQEYSTFLYTGKNY